MLFPFVVLILLSSSDVIVCIGRNIKFRTPEGNSKTMLPEDRVEMDVSHGHLCNTEVKQVEVQSIGLYEFRPRFYTEVRCTNAMFISAADIFVDTNNGHCSTLSMHCVQQYRVMQLMRRRRDDKDMCWELAHVEINVPYGCECMYPHEEIRFS